MTALLASVAAALILTGLLLGVLGLRRTAPPPPRPSRGRAGRAPRLSRRSRLLLLAGLVAGFAVALLTGWVVAVVVLPAAAAGIPALLNAPAANRKISRLDAMEEWTRSLAGVLTVGVGLEQALIATLRSTPDAIRPEVGALTARLRARWTTTAAVRAFADDLDDATGDLIAATLLLGAQRRGAGLASVLEGLAESVAADVRARRAVEADRAKPRTTARWITIITLVVLIGLALNGNYIAPYGTALGQAILLCLLAAYALVLVWMQRMSRGDEAPRFIGTHINPRGQA